MISAPVRRTLLKEYCAANVSDSPCCADTPKPSLRFVSCAVFLDKEYSATTFVSPTLILVTGTAAANAEALNAANTAVATKTFFIISSLYENFIVS